MKNSEIKKTCAANITKNAEFKKRVRTVLLNTGYPDYALAIRAFNQVVAITGKMIGSTDGRNLYINEELNDDELSIVVRHEILHILLKHRAREPKRGLRFRLWNKACDFELSNYYSVYDESVIAQSEMLDGACYVGNSPQYADKTAPIIYNDLLEEEKEEQKKQQQNKSNGCSGQSNYKESDNAGDTDDIQQDRHEDTQSEQNQQSDSKEDQNEQENSNSDMDSNEEESNQEEESNTDEDNQEDSNNQQDNTEQDETDQEDSEEQNDGNESDTADEDDEEDSDDDLEDTDSEDSNNDDLEDVDSEENNSDIDSKEDEDDSITAEEEENLCRAIEMAVTGGYEELTEEERQQMENSELVQLSSNSIITPPQKAEPPKATDICRLKNNLKSYFIKQEQVEKGRTYKKGNKKYYGSPFIIKGKSNIYKPSKTIACYVDVSSSMTKEKVQRAINVVEGLKKIKRLEVKIHYFDTQVRDYFFEGGCTDYAPIFKHAKENNYTCLAIVTDDTTCRHMNEHYDFEAIWLIGIARKWNYDRQFDYYGPENIIATKTHPATRYEHETKKPYVTCKKFHFDMVLPEPETV